MLWVQASSHGGEEEGSLQLKLEYMAGPEMPEAGPGEPKLGRHLLLPLRLHLLPSLQVPALASPPPPPPPPPAPPPPPPPPVLPFTPHFSAVITLDTTASGYRGCVYGA